MTTLASKVGSMARCQNMPSQITVKARVTDGMSSAGAMRPSSFSCWNSFRKLSLM